MPEIRTHYCLSQPNQAIDFQSAQKKPHDCRSCLSEIHQIYEKTGQSTTRLPGRHIYYIIHMISLATTDSWFVMKQAVDMLCKNSNTFLQTSQNKLCVIPTKSWEKLISNLKILWFLMFETYQIGADSKVVILLLV